MSRLRRSAQAECEAVVAKMGEDRIQERERTDRRFLGLLLVSSGAFLAPFDAGAVTVALPSLTIAASWTAVYFSISNILSSLLGLS